MAVSSGSNRDLCIFWARILVVTTVAAVGAVHLTARVPQKLASAPLPEPQRPSASPLGTSGPTSGPTESAGENPGAALASTAIADPAKSTLAIAAPTSARAADGSGAPGATADLATATMAAHQLRTALPKGAYQEASREAMGATSFALPLYNAPAVRPTPPLPPETPRPELARPQLPMPQLPRPELPRPQLPSPELAQPRLVAPSPPVPEAPRAEPPLMVASIAPAVAPARHAWAGQAHPGSRRVLHRDAAGPSQATEPPEVQSEMQSDPVRAMLASAGAEIGAGRTEQARVLLMRAQTRLVFASGGGARRTAMSEQIVDALASLGTGAANAARARSYSGPGAGRLD